MVPDFFWAEVANTIWKAVRRGRLEPPDGQLAIAELLVLAIPTLGSRELLREAHTIAAGSGCAVYDCIYVSLAIETGRELMMADQRLTKSLAPRYPVRWLGAI